MKHFFSFLSCIAVLVFAADAVAKKPTNITKEFELLYPPAVDHRGLENPIESLDLSKMKSYAVILKGGIPAERAAFYIGWEDYDYRGATIDGDEIKTRRGPIYTFLQPGDVMAVVNADHLGRTLYIKMISADIYIPENRSQEKRHSRVTVMLGLKLPKDVYKDDNVQKAVEILGEWLRPFKDIDDAKTFGAKLAKENGDKAETKDDFQVTKDDTEAEKNEVVKKSPKMRAPQRRDR